jgi:hypothetical protein
VGLRLSANGPDFALTAVAAIGRIGQTESDGSLRVFLDSPLSIPRDLGPEVEETSTMPEGRFQEIARPGRARLGGVEESQEMGFCLDGHHRNCQNQTGNTGWAVMGCPIGLLTV